MTPKRRTEKKSGKQPRSGADPAMSIGIDLGTTRTVVSLADRGNYPVAGFTDLFGDDHDFLPSLSALTDEGLVHGFEARRAARRGAPLVRSLKRRLSSPTASWSAPVSFGSTSLPLGEVLASYLRYLRERLWRSSLLAGVDLGDERHRIAVAVPAHAYGAQRMITLDAFAAAGFHVTSMLNEPSAAGFEYSHRRGSTVSSRRTRVLTYDLGGGTFDTALVDVVGRDHEVLAARGQSDLGGDDIDLLLAEMILERAGVGQEELSSVETDDLLDQCREAKESLAPQTRRIVIDLRGRPVILQTAELYDAARPLLQRSLELMEPLVGGLDDGAPDLTEIAGIYLVGGASAFPPVARMLRERYGRRVHRSPYPGASTAIGLAIAVDPHSNVTLTDRLARGFGVFREADDGRRTTFDAILAPGAVQDSDARPAEGAPATVIERQYPAVHNVGRYRFAECSGIDERGEPVGELAPWREVLFPLDRDLRDVPDLGAVEVRRTGCGPWVRERYEIDSAGLVRVSLTDLSDGFTRTYLLGERRRGLHGPAAGGAALGQLVLHDGGAGRVVGGELGQGALDLVPHASDGDAEDALPALDQVDDLVGAGALVDGGAVAHQGDGGQVLHTVLVKGVDRCADLLEGDAGVEQPLDDLEQQDVTEGVQALRAGALGSSDGGLDQPGTGPVVQLPVGDAGDAAGHRATVAGVDVKLRERIAEQHPLAALGYGGVKTGFVRAH